MEELNNSRNVTFVPHRGMVQTMGEEVYTGGTKIEGERERRAGVMTGAAFDGAFSLPENPMGGGLKI
jgi:hypothetical protein